jgi:hypothetical protein
MSDLKWFARGGGMAKMGPYSSQAEAAAALITTDGIPVEGAFVWPETPDQTRRYAKMSRDRMMRKGDIGLAKVYDVLADECERRGMKMPRKR